MSRAALNRPDSRRWSRRHSFTAISERLEPERVVQMLNASFEVMVELVLEHNGTINKITGDALLIIFGAPQEIPDRARRAIACAIEMQNAMAEVNARNRAQGLPQLQMGIGLNEADVVVGNIGSSRRSKYAVVGSGVNMTGRIESYTVGGEILVSESVRQAAGEVLRIDGQRDVPPKGAEAPLRLLLDQSEGGRRQGRRRPGARPGRGPGEKAVAWAGSSRRVAGRRAVAGGARVSVRARTHLPWVTAAPSVPRHANTRARASARQSATTSTARTSGNHSPVRAQAS